MKFVIYYHKDTFTSGQILEAALNQEFAGVEHQVFQTFNGLKERFKQICNYNEKEIFIILADSRGRLEELTTLIDLMEDKRLILILFDESKATLSKASRFFPRFCTKISSNYGDLCKVLNKMTATPENIINKL